MLPETLDPEEFESPNSEIPLTVMPSSATCISAMSARARIELIRPIGGQRGDAGRLLDWSWKRRPDFEPGTIVALSDDSVWSAGHYMVTDLLCLRLCSEPSQVQSNPRAMQGRGRSFHFV